MLVRRVHSVRLLSSCCNPVTYISHVTARNSCIRSAANRSNAHSSHSSSTNHHYSTKVTQPKLIELKSRGLIEVKGHDSRNLLQGLLTNNIECLGCQKMSLYAMLLNVQGRVLYDILLYNVSKNTDENKIFMECEKGAIPDIMKLLKIYKIRKKVDITDVSTEFKCYALLGRGQQTPDFSVTEDGAHIFEDPRLPDIGERLIAPQYIQEKSLIPEVIANEDEEVYHEARYRLGIGEGTADFPPGSSLPLESNLEILNGVDFNKGCYLGQELTARTHHTGVIRKRLMPLEFDCVPDIEPGEKIVTDSGQTVGKFRNSVGKFGLGLLRVSQVKDTVILNSKDGRTLTAKTHRPPWWPSDLKM